MYTRVDAAEAHVPRRAPVLLAAVLSLALVSLSLVHVRAPAPVEALPVVSTRTLGSAHCVFLHGAGSNETGPPTPTFPTYWGAIHEHTPACAHRQFLHADTLHPGWEDESLQRSVCELINAAARPRPVQQGAARPARRVLIFAHSMGNLVLAAALSRNVCTLPAHAGWFAAAPPWLGSRAAERIPALCSGGAGQALERLARRVGMCDGAGHGPSRGYWSVRTSNRELATLATWRDRVNATMCGSSPFGFWWSADAYELRALAAYARIPRPNDGVVTISSCTPLGHPPLQHSDPAGAGVYVAAADHFDLTCRHGDGWIGADRRPCAWYAARR